MNMTILVVPVAVLILGAYCVPLLRRLAPDLSSRLPIFFTGIAGAVGVHLMMITANGSIVHYHAGGWGPPFGIEVRLGFSEAFVLTTIAVVGLMIAIWSQKGLAGEIHSKTVPWFYTMFLLTLAGMIGVTMAGDLFNMYVFIEVTGIGAVALAAARSDRLGTLASFEYLALAAVGSGFILMGIGLIYMVTGHLNLPFVASELETVWQSYPNLLWVAAAMFLIGFGVKGALFPLHVWLPNAHSSAPSPASAVLSGLVVKVYAFGLLKVMSTILVGGDPAPTWDIIRVVIIILASAAIIGGSLFALVQKSMKRLLAYSTVAQVGYIFLGIGIGSVGGLVAAVFHIMAHSLMKSCMFLAVGTIAQRTGAKYISEYDGMGRRMPYTMAAFTIGALSMIGIPGLAGLISKWLLASSAMEAGMPWLAVLMVVSGLLNAAYYLPILMRAYFRSSGESHSVVEGPASMTAPLMTLAAGSVIMGLVPRAVLEILGRSLAMGF